MNLPVSGSDCVLRISDGRPGSAFLLVEGLRLSGWKFALDEVDVTTQVDGGWRRLLPGAGPRSLEVQLRGLYLGSPGELKLRQAAFEGTLFDGQMTLDESEEVRGQFLVCELRVDGAINEEATYSAVLRSSGPITIG